MAAKIDMRMVYAVAGRRVRDPAHPQKTPIPADGRLVAWGPYWDLALTAGDITLEPPAAPEPAAPIPAAKPVAPPPPAAPAAAPDVKA